METFGGMFGMMLGAPGMGKSKFKVGDKVKVLKDKSKVKQLQRDHGGWNELMRPMLGEKGKVMGIFPDGNLLVKILGNLVVMNPECVKKVEGTRNSDDDVPDAMKMMKQMAKIFGQDDSDKSDKSDKSEDEEISSVLKMDHKRLLFVVKKGDIEQTKTLVDLVGPNISMKKLFPLLVAVSEGYDNIVELLLSKGAEVNAKDSDGDSSLHIAVQKNHLEICKILISKGADVNAQNKVKLTPVMLAAMMGFRDILKYLVVVQGVDLSIGDKDKDTALHLAIQRSRLDSVEILLEAGANIEVVNKRQFPSYHWAALMGHEKILEVFLKKAGPSTVDLQKEDKFAAIHLAASNNHTGCLRMLIRNNADLNIRNITQQTALHIAVSQKYLECVKILVENRAEMNLKDGNGDTPIHLGVQASSLDRMKKMGSLFGMPGISMMMGGSDSPDEIVMYLAQKGAKLDIKNNIGKTAITACDDDTLKAKLMSIKKGGVNSEAAATSKDDLEMELLKQKIKKLEEVNICKKCLDRQIECTMSCGHVFCEVCAREMTECYICHSPIKDIIKIHR